MIPAQLVLDARARLGEGAIWHDRALWWVDIESHLVHRFDPVAKTDRSWSVGQRAGTVVPRQRGGMVVAVEHGIGFLDTESGRFTVVLEPEAGRDDVRFNDGKCDPRGRFFAGTMGLIKPRRGAALYCIDADLRVVRLLEDLGNSNGLAWSHDERTFYHIDTPTREVSAFDYDATSGAISNRRTAVKFGPDEPGAPDGMTIDAEGNLWIALFGGSGVVCCDPRTGEIRERVSVPASQTTSCAFGGPDLHDLFITTARQGLNEEQLRREPHAGGIFVARPGARGVRAFSFAG